MRSTRWLSTTLLVACLGACTAESPSGSVPATPFVSPSRTVSFDLPPQAFVPPSPTPWPIEEGDKVMSPSSEVVELGDTEELVLYTHCGIDWKVDFDGSFWQFHKGPYPKKASVGDPFQKGTMQLSGEDLALFVFESGGRDAVAVFFRNDTPKPRGVCL